MTVSPGGFAQPGHLVTQTPCQVFIQHRPLLGPGLEETCVFVVAVVCLALYPLPPNTAGPCGQLLTNNLAIKREGLEEPLSAGTHV